MKQKPPLKLTAAEIRVLVEHVSADLKYGDGGTFIRFDVKGDAIFDEREAAIARRAVEKLKAHAGL